MITFDHAVARLEEISRLESGWHFGEGIAPYQVSLKLAHQLLRFAPKTGLKEMEVFPSVDGSVEVHLYNGNSSIELTCETNGSISFLIEKPDEERRRVKSAQFKEVLREILTFALWSSTDSSIPTTGRTRRVDTFAQASKRLKAESPSYASPARIVAREMDMNPSRHDYIAYIHPDHITSSQSYGSLQKVISEKEFSLSIVSPQAEMFATTI